MTVPLNPLAEDLQHVLEHTRDLWEELRGERIFITGGTGFFGCWLLESLAWANDQLSLDCQATVLTRSPNAFREKAPHLTAHPAVVLLEGDVRTFQFPAGRFSHIIHAATASSAKLNEENPLLMLDTIIEGTRHTLDFAVRCNATRFLLTSSGAVYGKQPADITHIPEEYSGAPDPLEPKSAYGEGKRLAEHLCALYARRSNIEMKIARCFAFVGPYLPLDAHFAIGNFIRDGLKGGPIIVQGDGTPYRSYLYAADLAICLWTILFQAGPLRPFNVGSELAFTIAGLASIVAAAFHPEPEVRFRQFHNPAQSIDRYVPSTRRIRDELSQNEHTKLEDSIARTIKWESLRAIHSA